MPLGAQLRLNALFDKVYGSIGEERQSQDLIGFVDQISYSQRLKNAQKKTGLSEALLVQYGLINNQRVVIAAFDFDFIGGSMGKVVGERFVQAVHFAIKQRYPLVCIATSGGARMQESLYALMQMRQTAAALAKLSQHGSPYIVILASPCMGGVSASLAMLGDIIIAEPRATIGFTGRRVIEQTMKQRLPDDFQQSEFLLAHGAIDMIVDRRDLKEVLLRLLRRLSKGASI
jgi:acetyl-CoA carboxylase carboxyl transferase subunit beta